MNLISQLVPALLNGFKMSLIVFALTLVASIPLGILIAIVFRHGSKSIKFIITLYTSLIRGTPLLLQLYLVFYGLPLLIPMNIRDYRLAFAVITFIVNYTAYFVEIFRGALSQINPGQWEASKMLGMNLKATYLDIIIPQMIRKSIFTLSNEAITLIKDTSLMAAVAIPELLTLAKESLSRDSRVDALVIAAGLYLAFTFLVVMIIKKLTTLLRVEVNQ